jgi:hypothetical protein
VSSSLKRPQTESVAQELLTPAPDVAAVTWKKATLASGEHKFTDVKTERIERAIANDIAFLAAIRRERRSAHHEAPAPIPSEAEPAAAVVPPPPAIGQDKVTEKITPSGSKTRVPAAPSTGPLKSPARRNPSRTQARRV